MPDKNEALEEIHQIRRAADQGDCDARYTLAAYYEHAAGGRQDMEQAAYWYRQAALQGHKAAIEKCSNMGIDLNAPRIERELMRGKLQCRIFPLSFLERYKYTVVCAAYQGKWLLSRHRQRSTWETQGGHIEAGETPLACAKRELFEESGVRDAEIYPVCDYWGFNRQACANGMVFLAVVHALGELPESEMKARLKSCLFLLPYCLISVISSILPVRSRPCAARLRGWDADGRRCRSPGGADRDRPPRA